MKVCTNCKKELPDNAVFCNNCGTKVEAEVEAESTRQAASEKKARVCSNCGNELKEGAKFCPKCGQKVKDKYQINLKVKLQNVKGVNGKKYVKGIISVAVFVLVAAGIFMIGKLFNNKDNQMIYFSDNQLMYLENMYEPEDAIVVDDVDEECMDAWFSDDGKTIYYFSNGWHKKLSCVEVSKLKSKNNKQPGKKLLTDVQEYEMIGEKSFLYLDSEHNLNLYEDEKEEVLAKDVYTWFFSAEEETIYFTRENIEVEDYGEEEDYEDEDYEDEDYEDEDYEDEYYEDEDYEEIVSYELCYMTLKDKKEQMMDDNIHYFYGEQEEDYKIVKDEEGYDGGETTYYTTPAYCGTGYFIYEKIADSEEEAYGRYDLYIVKKDEKPELIDTESWAVGGDRSTGAVYYTKSCSKEVQTLRDLAEENTVFSEEEMNEELSRPVFWDDLYFGQAGKDSERLCERVADCQLDIHNGFLAYNQYPDKLDAGTLNAIYQSDEGNDPVNTAVSCYCSRSYYSYCDISEQIVYIRINGGEETVFESNGVVLGRLSSVDRANVWINNRGKTAFRLRIDEDEYTTYIVNASNGKINMEDEISEEDLFPVRWIQDDLYFINVDSGELYRYDGKEMIEIADISDTDDPDVDLNNYYNGCYTSDDCVIGRTHSGLYLWDEKGETIEIDDEVSSYCYLAKDKILYICDGDLYLYTGEDDTIRIARDVEKRSHYTAYAKVAGQSEHLYPFFQREYR